MIISNLIKQEYERYGFVSFFLYGPQGSGKTTLALLELRDVYGSWREALKHTYFHLEPLVADLRDAFQERRRIPAILIDDAGIALLKYRWQKEAEQWFGKFYNLIRTVAAGIIFTSVESDDIIRFVRRKIRYIVKVERRGDWAIATGYVRHLSPLGDYYVERAFEIEFQLHLPEKVREKYEALRRQAVAKLFSEGNSRIVTDAEIIKRARELRKQGLSYAKIAKQIQAEFGVKKSRSWYHLYLSNSVQKHPKSFK